MVLDVVHVEHRIRRDDVPRPRGDHAQVMYPLGPPPRRSGVYERFTPLDVEVEAAKLEACRRVDDQRAVEGEEELAIGDGV